MFKQPQKFENSPKFMVIFKPCKFEKKRFSQILEANTWEYKKRCSK